MKKGKVAALAGILAAVGMGLFFPDFVAGVADQKMKDQEEHFPWTQLPLLLTDV